MFSDDLFNVFDETPEPKKPKTSKRARQDNEKSAESSKKPKGTDTSEARPSTMSSAKDMDKEDLQEEEKCVILLSYCHAMP